MKNKIEGWRIFFAVLFVGLFLMVVFYVIPQFKKPTLTIYEEVCDEGYFIDYSKIYLCSYGGVVNFEFKNGTNELINVSCDGISFDFEKNCTQVEVEEIEYLFGKKCIFINTSIEDYYGCLDYCLDSANDCLHKYTIYDDTAECENYLHDCDENCEIERDNGCLEYEYFYDNISKSELTTSWLDERCECLVYQECPEGYKNYSSNDFQYSNFTQCITCGNVISKDCSKYSCFDKYEVSVE